VKKPSKKAGKAKRNSRRPTGGATRRTPLRRAARATGSQPARRPAAPREAPRETAHETLPPAVPIRAAPGLAAVGADERKSFLLIFAPFLLLALAIGIAQTLGPKAALRRQIAALPPLPARLDRLAPPVLAGLPPMAAARLVAAPRNSAASNGRPEARLKAVPPQTMIAAVPAQLQLSRCDAPWAAGVPPRSTPVGAMSPAAFGLRLAHAAAAQTADLVVYSDKYRQIKYPMGDVPPFYGVCADVVVRAYRALGIDLQALVHEARLGTGDPSIDQRRTQTLRRFFTRYGVSLPVTDFVEDYRPGDIVTYHRDGGRTSQSHIAIVADVIAPSGRPMIVHNRGWGPQLEDALFAREITGHYRFTGMTPGREAEMPSKGAPGRGADQSPLSPHVRLSANSAR
jgi:uncharacterized protein YijF (DUF1287 family)